MNFFLRYILHHNHVYTFENFILITLLILQTVRLGAPGYLESIERAVEMGDTLLMENIFESVDPVLDHILGRNTIQKGKAIKVCLLRSILTVAINNSFHLSRQ